jgi:hypothetical protein
MDRKGLSIFQAEWFSNGNETQRKEQNEMPVMNDDDIIGQSRYVTGDGLAESGPEVVKVEAVKRETFTDNNTGKEETKEILVLEDGRGVTLNGTRKEQLKELFGAPLKVSAVVGQHIELYADKVKFGPKKVNSVQIRKAATAF